MTDKLNDGLPGEPVTADALRNWVMVLLTVILVALYSAALIGWLRPVTDGKMVSRIEPIIFVIIGYYISRLPSQENEKTLKGEIARQTNRADAAQHAREQAQQTIEAFEEKVKNARATLISAVQRQNDLPAGVDASRWFGEAGLRSGLDTALSILNS
jgi:hypothetical protein